MAEGNRVFVGNITGRVHKQELKVDFEKFGRVNEVFIGNGFGFVTFDDSRSASRAVDEMHGQHYAGERLRVEISYDNSRGRGRGRGGGRGAPPPRRGRDDRGPPPRERSPPYERDSRGHRPPSYERERDHHRRDFSPRGPPGRGVRERSPYDRYESRAPAPPPPSYRDYRDRRESPPGRYRSRESPPRGPPRGGPRDYERERERERAPPYVMAPERRRPDRYTSDRYRSRSPGPPPGPSPRDHYFSTPRSADRYQERPRDERYSGGHSRHPVRGGYRGRGRGHY